MQSANTRRFAHLPLATALVAAAGLASGILALGVTDNLPGQTNSATSVQVAPAVLAPTAGERLVSPEGRVSPRLIEGVLGPASNPAKNRSRVTWAPSFGQGEGLVGPGATLDPAVREGTEQDWADRLPRREMPPDTIRPKTGLRTYPGIGFNPGDVNLLPAPVPTMGAYTLDPHAAGITEY